MAKHPGPNPKGNSAFFDVFYEDGSSAPTAPRALPPSCRRLGRAPDEPRARFIMEQDPSEIAEKPAARPWRSDSADGAKKK